MLRQGKVAAIPPTQGVLPKATSGCPFGCPFGPPPIGGPSSCKALALKSKPAAKKAKQPKMAARNFLEECKCIGELLAFRKRQGRRYARKCRTSREWLSKKISRSLTLGPERGANEGLLRREKLTD